MFLFDSVLFCDHLDSAKLEALHHFVNRWTVTNLVDTILLGITDAKLVRNHITGFLEQSVQRVAEIISLLFLHFVVL